MKTVILVLAAFVAVNAQTYQECNRTPQYTQEISPVVCPAAGLMLPIYSNAQTYYKCTTVAGRVSPIPTNCSNSNYFSYPLQGCQPCASYLPSAPCSSLAFGPNCVDINSAEETTTVAPTTTTAAPTETTTTTTTTTTASPTTTTTAATTTTQSVPTPPTESDTTSTPSGSDDVITPSGTTISVPQPPSPNDSNVPTPNTPYPTAPIIVVSPPTITAAPST
ncbi:peritrophin-55 [Drosophila bipectinata]|uniref:peritrophin-55 n=1 Tax=Drosophila bipectinata TaxID=42026 RepID=UPI001C8ACB2E|nr:integumentary mucin A.1 [Drosophila bipectinata]